MGSWFLYTISYTVPQMSSHWEHPHYFSEWRSALHWPAKTFIIFSWSSSLLKSLMSREHEVLLQFRVTWTWVAYYIFVLPLSSSYDLRMFPRILQNLIIDWFSTFCNEVMINYESQIFESSVKSKELVCTQCFSIVPTIDIMTSFWFHITFCTFFFHKWLQE